MTYSTGIAASSELAANAAVRLVEQGGNAVDAAIGAALISAISEPGMVALGSGGYIVVWPPDGPPVSIDGGVEMPGRGLPQERFGRGAEKVHLDYIGGCEALVGAGTVATPGTLAAFAEASRRYGVLPWRELIQPAIELVRAGFPMGAPSYRYLSASHELIFGREPQSFAALHDDDGELLPVGALIHIPELGDSLELIAMEGVEAFYQGDLAVAIASDIEAADGILRRADLAAYEARVSEPMAYELGPWQLASAAPSAIGGAVLGVMVHRSGELMANDKPWSDDWVRHVVHIQNEVLSFRYQELDLTPEFSALARSYFDAALAGTSTAATDSASTVHNSVADVSGLSCAITISAGYGSGVMPAGTGIWLNNCLGELELNCTGFHALAPGSRLLSNMAPTVGRSSTGGILSMGSPGSGRITTAQYQTLINLILAEWPLDQAIAHPRLHLAHAGAFPQVHVEPGVKTFTGNLEWKPVERLDTYFGGVGAVRIENDQIEAARDPRRSGAVARA
ncbi:MAG: gamma-glutamyltransferase [Pseudomonadota bacterium]